MKRTCHEYEHILFHRILKNNGRETGLIKKIYIIAIVLKLYVFIYIALTTIANQRSRAGFHRFNS